MICYISVDEECISNQVLEKMAKKTKGGDRKESKTTKEIMYENVFQAKERESSVESPTLTHR